MQNVSKNILIIIGLSLLITGMLYAKPNTIVDDVLLIPKAAKAPIIDGVLDGVWYSTTQTWCNVLDPETGERDDWYDQFTTFRAMWDENYLYLFVTVRDEIIRTDNSAAYANDGVEFYFDGDNSKLEGSYDSFDDIQLRINYDDVDTDGIDVGYGTAASWEFDKSGIEFAVADYETPDAIGFIVEVAFPLEDLLIVNEPDLEFGFDIQINDNDDGDRNHMYRWWANNNNEWQDASLFGTAMFDTYEADSIMNVVQAQGIPEIDGELDDIWLNVPEVSHNTYVYEPPDQYQDIEYYDDLHLFFRTMWDLDAFYFFANVIDEEINIERSEAWLIDGFELYFDGDNSKNDKDTGKDDNDVQIRWTYGMEAAPGGALNAVHAFADTDSGYTFELMIPAEDMTFDLEEGHVFGFEVQTNDNDEGERQNMARWWSADNDSWQNFSLLGTARLHGGPVAVEHTSASTKIDHYKLEQNYPNPFNPTTTIVYRLKEKGMVKLAIYDLLGKEVATVVNEIKSAGRHQVEFNATGLTSGLYFYKLNSGTQVLTKKMMLLK